MQMEIIDTNQTYDSLDMLNEVQLDRMVEVSLSEPVLKNNFELIIKVLREHKIQLRSLKLNERKQDEGITQNKERIGQLEIENSELKNQMQDLLNKNEQLSELCNNQDTKMQKMDQNLSELQEKMNTLLEKWKMLAELNNSNASADLLVELQQQLNQTKINMNDILKQMQDFALKTDLEDAAVQIEDNTKDIQDLQKEITRFGNIDNLQKDVNTLYQRLSNLENQIIPDKFGLVDGQLGLMNEDIEGSKLQLSQIYDILNKLNEKEGKEIKFEMPAPQIDNSKLKAAESRINELEQQLRALQDQINLHLAEFMSFKDSITLGFEKINKDKLNKSDFDLQSLMDQFHSVRALISTISNSLEATNQKVEKNGDDIQVLFSKLSQKMGQIKQIEQQRPIDAIDENQVMALIQNFNNKLNDEFMKKIQEILQILETKADKAELKELEDRLMQLINEIFAKLSKFADKAETKKVLALLEKRINELYQMIAGDNNNKFFYIYSFAKSLDGLLVKRPLGWSCCSCNQDLDKYRGQLGDYLNWAIFPPKETIPQRMGKYAVHYANDIQAKKFAKERSKLQTGDNSQVPSTFQPQTTTAQQYPTSDNFYPSLQNHSQQNFEKYFMSTTGNNFAKKLPKRNNAFIEGQAFRPIHSVHHKDANEESGIKVDISKSKFE